MKNNDTVSKNITQMNGKVQSIPVSRPMSETELSERILILKRFKSLLEQQRARFQQYLQVLEAQEKSIVTEDVDKIVQHSELEQSIISEISTIQKVIDPIESMYRQFGAVGSHSSFIEVHRSEQEMEKIKSDLQRLQASVLHQNQINRDKIKVHLAGLRKQISLLKTMPQRSVFDSSETSSLIDIRV